MKKYMNLVKKQINLNVRNPNNYQIIHAMQGDNESIEITATIWDGNAKYTIDCDNITIDVISPSGVQNQLSVISHTINEVVFRLDKNVLAENGEHQLVIHFMDQPDISLTTYPNILYVTNAPLGTLPEGTIATITKYVEECKKAYDVLKEVTDGKGQPNGIAILDENGKVPLVELPDASTTQKGIVQLTDSISSTSTTTAATPNSVKMVYEALQKLDDTTVSDEDIDLLFN